MKHVSAGVKVAVLFLLVVGSGYLVWQNLGGDAAGESDFALWANFRDASGLPEGSRVVIAGLPVGEIRQRVIDGRHAKVIFTLRDDVVIWSNAIVYKKSTSLLGDYYIEIDPGTPVGVDVTGEPETNARLRTGEQVARVVEATTPDQLMRRIEDSLPNVDEVLRSVNDLAQDVRRLVNGPIASTAARIDDLVQQEADTVAQILARVDSTVANIEAITRDIRAVTGPADGKVNRILDRLEEASTEARDLVVSARAEVEATGSKVREKLDLVDEVLVDAASISRKIDENEGTLGRLVNDSAIADNVEEITDDAKGFLGTLFNLQTYVGLRSEYNWESRLARHYVTLELATRPDKYYLIELEKGPRGDYPVVTLEYDPTVNRDAYVRKVTIEDQVRFTFQFAKRWRFLTFRYGLKESTGGVGVDFETTWLGRGLRINTDLFDATFDQLPRLKVTAALEVFRGLYVLGGIDEALNQQDQLTLDTGDFDVPIQFEEFKFGRDYFLGMMLRFNDQDLAALLTVGGSAVSAAVE